MESLVIAEFHLCTAACATERVVFTSVKSIYIQSINRLLWQKAAQ